MTTRTETPNILDNVLTLSGATPAPPAATLLALTAIVNDGGTQMRAGMDAATITEYADALAEADAWPFPPIVVFHDGEKYWLADGFHRVNAAHRNGKFSQIPADVRAGTRRDAILHAAGANAAHGLRRTNGDKRRAVEVLLRDPEWSQWSNYEIAKRCAVAESSVRNIRAELERTTQIAQSVVRKGADGRTINTQNIGTNRPAPGGTMPKYTVEQLRGMVRACAVETGMTPAGEMTPFWSKLQTWMTQHSGNTLWSVSDLRMALDQVMRQDKTQPAVGLLAVWELERVAREVSKEIYGDKPQPFALNDMRQGARMRQGRFWLLCVKTINANNWRHADLAQAIQNVAEQMAQRMVEATPAASRPSPLAPDAEGDLHAGAGRTPAPPLTVAELVEDLDGYLAGIPAAEIDQAAKGAQNRALMTAQQCLSDFTYRQADLYRALQRLALQRGAPQPAEPVVDGERPLPAWAAPEPATVAQAVPEVVAVHGEVAPRPSQLARHPQHDELFEFAELFKLAIKETHRWAHITGEHTAILEAERGLRHLVERTAAILDGFTGQP